MTWLSILAFPLFIRGRLYRTTEAVAGTKRGIHDLSKRYRKITVIKTTASEGTPNATSSLHFFQRPRMIAIRNGTVARRTKVADDPKWKPQIGYGCIWRQDVLT
ncbi:hypothetical protein [Thermococcus sp.]|uniref:hypothetical protein n=1 Tax=Thermococcus sp. TaxID=35749 RepID=UPI0026318123|nr:hypothetical protein [Thermococcus sp.]